MAERHRLTSTTSARQAFEHVKALAALGPRIAGTARERKAADYVAQQFKSYGLPVDLQAVPGIMAWEGGEARLRGSSVESRQGFLKVLLNGREMNSDMLIKNGDKISFVPIVAGG